MTFKRYRIIFILIFMLLSENFGDQTPNQVQKTNDSENAKSDNKEGRALFPRMEYTNEWQPVGRGDPLKDPTYDYMPPVLDRVRYWGEGNSNKNKNDILMLGVPSKKMSMKQKDKFTHGPIKRTYFSQSYQSHYSPSQYHPHQQQPYRMMAPPSKHVPSDSHPMSTHFYQQHPPVQHGWKTANNVYSEFRPENSIHHKKMPPRPVTTPQEMTNLKFTSSRPFLPTVIPDTLHSHEASSMSPTLPMSTQTTVKQQSVPMMTINGHMMPTRMEDVAHKGTTKPLLQSILQTETASPFTKMPSSVYQIEYTSNIINAEDINSMATTSTFTPTKPTVRPMSVKTTMKTSHVPSSTPTTEVKETQKQNYVQPEMQTGWPVYNLIIEGHSKVKTYGLKNDDAIGNNLPKIRLVQPKDNPVVERVTNEEEGMGPEFISKHKKDLSKFSKKVEGDKTSTMTNLLSLLDTSFGNFFSDGSAGNDKVRHESENKTEENEKKNSAKRKSRSLPDKDEKNKQERVFSVSFQVVDEDERPQNQLYKKGTVISDKLWPFQKADATR